MVQCEMCGTETGSPKTVKIEGAELDVCDECADFGTEVRTEETASASTKYSTSSSSSSSSSSGSQSSSRGSGGGRDMFDEMDEVVEDYDDRIRSARESESLTQEELADRLNEKASLIRKIERGDVLPSDDVQRELERELGIDLSMGGSDDDAEWSGGSSTGGTTLGDVVKRKD